MKTTPQFDNALAKFLGAWTDKLEVYRICADLSYFDKYVILEEPGKRYIRLIPVEYKDGKPFSESRSVGAFVDITTGDVLKPASWKAPAKHPRGNIYSEQNGIEAISPSGQVRYL